MPHLQLPPLTMSNDRRMNLTVGDCERLGCPDLPEGIMPKDQRREWFAVPPQFAAGSSPDDVDMNDVTEEQYEEMGQTLFVDDTNGFDKNKFVPIEPRGTLERQDLNSLTMGPRSQNRKKNTRQVRERDATIVKAAAARKKKDLLQSKLFTKEIGFNRFKNCRICISYVLRKKYPKLNITIPKRAHHKSCTFNTITRGRSEEYVTTMKMQKRNAEAAVAPLDKWRSENPN